MEFRTVCVIGLGYIGLPTASTLAAQGLSVLGVDINARTLQVLESGEIHIHEAGLREVFRAARAAGKLKVASQPSEADAFIIAVPTPFQSNRLGSFNGRTYRLADLDAVRAAARSIVPVLRMGNLVVLESTSPPRTTVDVVAPILEASGLKAGVDFHLAYSPERVLPGQILRELRENARVIGGITPASAHRAAELYRLFVQGEIVETDATTAEMVKLMENTFRDVNIAIANEFSRLSRQFGVDVWEAISLANRHPRVNILNPGPGVGGHCISVDPWFLVEAAPALTPLIAEARRVNDSQPAFVVDLIRQALGSIKGKRIAALGLAYKPNVDDARESPAAEVVRLLQHEGAEVRSWEPFKPHVDLPGISLSSGLEAAVAGADAVVLLVAHTDFRELRPNEIAQVMRGRVAVDTVNAWDADSWRQHGFSFHRLGSPQPE
ncbi:MAG TPA: nucleotide sugar dehydrogenase [Anaerolineales bacterium]|nr:nucleotide sugar dehydrogenase [Anaerolineales bacterium]